MRMMLSRLRGAVKSFFKKISKKIIAKPREAGRPGALAAAWEKEALDVLY